jgi:diguanylate cyclase (GGDEF)-like protein/PAS domain S-box-containing protein
MAAAYVYESYMRNPHLPTNATPQAHPALQEVAEKADKLIFATDANGVCLKMNSGARMYFGDLKDVTLRSWCDFIHTEDQARVREAVEQAEAAQSDFQVRYRLVRSDGSTRWLVDTGAPWLTSDGKFAGYLRSIVDVSDAHTSMQVVTAQKEHFRRLTALTSDWFWSTDPEGRFTFVSEGLHAKLGLDPSDIVGRPAREVLVPMDENLTAQHYQTLADRKSFRDVVYITTMPGLQEQRYLNVSAEPIIRENQFRGYRGATRDITDKVKDSLELETLVAESQGFIEKAADLMTVFNDDGHIIRVNEAAKHLLGYETWEMIGRSYEDFVHPDDLSITVAKAASIAASNGVALDFENRWLRKDGSVIYLSWALLWSESRRSTYATARDMSERYHTREALLQSNKLLSRTLESIGDAFFSVDKDWRVTYMNRHCAEFVGMLPEEGVGRELGDVEPVLLGPALRDKIAGKLRTGETLQFEDFYAPRAVWLDVRVYSHEDGLSIFFHDISDHHAAQEALKLSEKRFRDVIETTPEGYILADENLSILDVNPSICAILDIDEEAIIGKPLHQLFDRERWDAFRKHLYDAGSTQSFEARLTFGNEVQVYALINASLEKNADGTPGLLTAFVTDITAQKESEARMEHLATRDPLTNLPNRLYLNERLKVLIAESTRTNMPLAVLFIDLDRFKEVNDSLGHDAGDVLLKEVAVRLKDCLRPEDLVARLGGDEFVVVVRSKEGRSAAEIVVEKIVRSLAQGVHLDGHEVFIGASIGICMLGEDGDTPEMLFQNADTAMYKAKAGGRNGYRFFTPEMNQEARTRLTLENALRHAIERNELALHYQPRLELSTMTVTGMEALLRWNHPQLGDIPPLEFIPLAEETGVINEIGEWVLTEACKQNKLWVEQFGRPLRVSVNVSARQLKSPMLAAKFKETLRVTGLPASLLELELTETALMEDPEKAARTLKELKQAGISLSIDDFGTGHSSLAYLRQFPIDSVKLDRSFLVDTVADVNPFKLAASIINLVHTLNLSVVAEGVESAETLAFLRSSSCDEVQGYYVAKPLPAAEFEAFIRKTGGTFEA